MSSKIGILFLIISIETSKMIADVIKDNINPLINAFEGLFLYFIFVNTPIVKTSISINIINNGLSKEMHIINISMIM